MDLGTRRRPARLRCQRLVDHDTELRVRCIRQLRDAMREHVEELREITMAEVGAPRMLTAAAAAGGTGGRSRCSPPTPPSPTDGAPISVKRRRWAFPTRRTVVREAGRRGGRHHPVELPAPRSTWPRSVRHWRPATPWSSSPLPTRPGARPFSAKLVQRTDMPPGVLNIVTSSDRAVGAMLAERSAGGPDVVHRVDGDRARGDGARQRPP